MLKSSSKYLKLVIFPIWVFVGFIIAQYLIVGILYILKYFNVPIKSMPSAVFNTAVAAAVYVVMLIIVIGVPFVLKKSRFSLADAGFKGLLRWMDIIIAPAGLIIYVIISALLISVAQRIIPGFNIDRVQDTGFSNLHQQYQYYLAFITLVIMAPIAEEIIFRGYLFSKLRKLFPFWVVAIVVSVTFGAIHGAWNVAVDTFALSLMLCYLRERTDSIWSPILLHMIKNSIAYFVLFIYPILSTTLGS